MRATARCADGLMVHPPSFIQAAPAGGTGGTCQIVVKVDSSRRRIRGPREAGQKTRQNQRGSGWKRDCTESVSHGAGDRVRHSPSPGPATTCRIKTALKVACCHIVEDASLNRTFTLRTASALSLAARAVAIAPPTRNSPCLLLLSHPHLPSPSSSARCPPGSRLLRRTLHPSTRALSLPIGAVPPPPPPVAVAAAATTRAGDSPPQVTYSSYSSYSYFQEASGAAFGRERSVSTVNTYRLPLHVGSNYCCTLPYLASIYQAAAAAAASAFRTNH
ncbi:hypothetical protein CC78DRAFT_576532 [Lojkania enalia]|uniref:Uncharacterized protein n=1 Tax=Lojkania enalia TaxID=147567 RepID=A0A9P4N346_9PLEO|nr:hypothetical protein CC78DRAFT_576532 [Didymosphaeria enalia]